MEPIPSTSSSSHVASVPDDRYDRASSPSSSIFTLPETPVPRDPIVSLRKAHKILGKPIPCDNDAEHISVSDMDAGQAIRLAVPDSEHDTSRLSSHFLPTAHSDDLKEVDGEEVVSDHEGESEGKGRSKQSILAPVGRLIRAFRRRKTTSIMRSGKKVTLSSPRPARIKNTSVGRSIGKRASSASVAGPSRRLSAPSTPEASRSTFSPGTRQSPKSEKNLRRTSTMTSRRSVGSTRSRESARRHVYEETLAVAETGSAGN